MWMRSPHFTFQGLTPILSLVNESNESNEKKLDKTDSLNSLNSDTRNLVDFG